MKIRKFIHEGVLPDGIVEGITVKFDNVSEMKKYFIQV
jgi:hypothetical protein